MNRQHNESTPGIETTNHRQQQIESNSSTENNHIYFPTPESNNHSGATGAGLQAVYYPLQLDGSSSSYSVEPSSQLTAPPVCIPPSHVPTVTQSSSCTYESSKYLEDYFKVIESFQGGQNTPGVYSTPGGVTGSGYYVPPIGPLTSVTSTTRLGSESNSDTLTPSRVAETFNNMYAHAFLNPPQDPGGIITDPPSDAHKETSASESSDDSEHIESAASQPAEGIPSNDKSPEEVIIVKVEEELDKENECLSGEETDVEINQDELTSLETLQPVTTESTSSSTGCVISASAGKPTRFLPPRKKRKTISIIDEMDEVEERTSRRKRGRPKRSIQNIEQDEIEIDDEDEDDENDEDDDVEEIEVEHVATVSSDKSSKKRGSKSRSRSRGTKICEKCNRKFERNDTYQRHLLLHDTKLLFGCHVCGGKYERQEHLTRHLRVHSGELYCCDICHSTFRQQRPFRDHMLKFHNERRPFICHIAGCSFRAQTPSQVEKHSEIHSDQKQYRCEKCGRDFAQINGLRSHQRSCYEKRQYLCDFCGAKFNFLGSLKSHRYIHTGEKPHQCPECDAKFTDHRNLRRHRLIHENAFPYPCTICDKKFRHSNSLKAHIKMHKLPPVSSNAQNTMTTGQSSNSSQMAPTGPVSGLSTQWERPEAQLVHEYMLALQHQASHVTQQVSQVTQV